MVKTIYSKKLKVPIKIKSRRLIEKCTSTTENTTTSVIGLKKTAEVVTSITEDGLTTDTTNTDVTSITEDGLTTDTTNTDVTNTTEDGLVADTTNTDVTSITEDVTKANIDANVTKNLLAYAYLDLVVDMSVLTSMIEFHQQNGCKFVSLCDEDLLKHAINITDEELYTENIHYLIVALRTVEECRERVELFTKSEPPNQFANNELIILSDVVKLLYTKLRPTINMYISESNLSSEQAYQQFFELSLERDLVKAKQLSHQRAGILMAFIDFYQNGILQGLYVGNFKPYKKCTKCFAYYSGSNLLNSVNDVVLVTPNMAMRYFLSLV